MPKLNTCELPGCNAPARDRFCCKAHHNSYRCRKKREERAIAKASKVVLCRHCKKRIDNPHSNQLFHHGECQRLGNIAKRKIGYAKKKKVIQKITLTCECGRTFEVSETNHKRQYCRNRECHNARQAAYKAERKANGIWVKQEKNTSPKREDPYKIVFMDIIAKCPTCGTRHIKSVVKGSSKWIYCDGCENNRYRPTMDKTPIALHMMTEY